MGKETTCVRESVTYKGNDGKDHSYTTKATCTTSGGKTVIYNLGPTAKSDEKKK